jgi:hypothetical protein
MEKAVTRLDWCGHFCPARTGEAVDEELHYLCIVDKLVVMFDRNNVVALQHARIAAGSCSRGRAQEGVEVNAGAPERLVLTSMPARMDRCIAGPDQSAGIGNGAIPT